MRKGKRGTEKERIDKILYQYLSLPSFIPQKCLTCCYLHQIFLECTETHHIERKKPKKVPSGKRNTPFTTPNTLRRHVDTACIVYPSLLLTIHHWCRRTTCNIQQFTITLMTSQYRCVKDSTNQSINVTHIDTVCVFTAFCS